MMSAILKTNERIEMYDIENVCDERQKAGDERSFGYFIFDPQEFIKDKFPSNLSYISRIMRTNFAESFVSGSLARIGWCNLVNLFYFCEFNSLRYSWTNCTAIEPSPTAEATRLTESLRTSPAAKTPARLVSRKNGGLFCVHSFESDEDCAVSYSDRGGKYQNQTGLTYAKV
ncbi:MAG: hypothetical protein M3R14_05100 [Acidobacteriota bacterium]|nr:hypothetical protein [Acidobacteriota bacterium]